MSTYIFILGKHRNLSLAELYARFPGAKWEAVGDDFLVLTTDKVIDQPMLNQLGGTIKVAKLMTKTNWINLMRFLSLDLINLYDGSKVIYGVSLHGRPQRELKTLLMELKKRLKKEGVKSRFVNQNFKNLSTAHHKDIGDKGFEYIAVDGGQGVYLGKVIAVQDIDAYSLRDYKKPYRDMQMGMLPPKLAQVLVNLTGDAQTIWDPFCGGGVLLIEAMLMGRSVVGSDINPDHMAGAAKNVKWVKQFKEAKGDYQLFVHDATQPKEGLQFDAIATESYLGPPQVRPLQTEEAKNQAEHLANLYLGFFNAIKKAGYRQPIVIALPYFKLEGKKEFDLRDVIGQIETLGFDRLPFLPNMPGIKDRYMLKYARPDQYVGRAIYQFQLR